MKILVTLFAVMLVTSSVYSLEGLDTDQRTRFRISADMARFRGDSSTVYVEVYYSFDVSQLAFTKQDGSLRSEVLMSIYFKRSANDSVVARDIFRVPFSTSDTTLLKTSRYYVDVVGFSLKPDVYRLFVVGKDLNEQARKDSFSVPFNLQPVERKQISLSDVELCTSIVPVEKDSTSRFIKNTYETRPNPTKLYGLSQPVIFYYLETYNINKNTSPTYYTKLTVTNGAGKEVINHEKMKRRLNESSVEVGTVKVNTLRTGTYTFSFNVFDSVDNSSYTTSKRFYIYNPSLPTDSLTAGGQSSVLASEYAAMSEAELDREFDQVRYIANREEMTQYKSLKGLDAKRKMLFEFWNKRDDDPSTAGNDQKTEYFKRIDYSNQHFKTGFREGWKTDRGRVFVVYGPPDEVERHANEVDVKPYEVWFYNSIQGGVQFIFGDRSGFSDYVLLHSTHREELHDENWMQQIQMQ